ncbi:hypothetical protein B0H10DRAFT_1952717 [Mycena sp. CBHHK59/15]|nr:hypothetical protein B0H10DRAFT_1952717 [Mycena sp. CBHHK59/15]
MRGGPGPQWLSLKLLDILDSGNKLADGMRQVKLANETLNADDAQPHKHTSWFGNDSEDNDECESPDLGSPSQTRSVEFDVEKIESMEWNNDVFANLVLQMDCKELGFNNFIKGKGYGLVINLFGPLGIGKTFSAEAMSRDLGTCVGELDMALKRVFDVATVWKAIVLIDKVFDEVFLSCIHVTLHFQELSKASKVQVWTAFITKNCNKSAQCTHSQRVGRRCLVSEGDVQVRKETLGLAHLVETLDPMDEFKEQFEGMKAMVVDPDA